MNNVKSVLIMVILAAIAAKLVWWVVEPLLPAVVFGISLIAIWSMFFRRKW